MSYREPTADDIGKIVEVSEYPDGDSRCHWVERKLVSVQRCPKRNLFRCGYTWRTAEATVAHYESILWEYARIKVDETS
jgi:hypothetical protein